MKMKIARGVVFVGPRGTEVAVVVNNPTEGIHIKDVEWVNGDRLLAGRRRKISKETLARSYTTTDYVCLAAKAFKLPAPKKVVKKARKAAKPTTTRGRPSKLQKLKKMCRPGRPTKKA